MALEINQNVSVEIPQFLNFSTALDNFGAQIQQLADAFTNLNTGGASAKDSAKDTLSRLSGTPEGEDNPKIDINAKLQGLIDALNKNTDKLNPRNFNAELSHQKSLNSLADEQRAKQRQERAEEKKDNREQIRQERNNNWSRSIAYGAGMLGIGAAGQEGKIIGSQGQAVNAGMLNYSDFMTNYYNKQADLQQSVVGGGLMSAAGMIAAKSPKIGIPLMAGAAALNYFMGENTEQKKAATQFGRSEELGAWRLNMSRMGGAATNRGLATGFGTTSLGSGQLLSLAPKYSPYAATYNDVVLGGKRDVMSKMNDKDLNEYNRALNLTAMAIGTSDIGGLNKSTTTLAGMTGDTPMNTLNKILEANQQYGGDTASNTAKLVQIMQTTNLSQGAASDLVNKYQFNDPMLNNKLAMATASPLDTARQVMMMKLGGANKEEIASGQLSPKHIKEIRDNAEAVRLHGIGALNPRLQMLSQSALPGQNLYANALGNINPTGAPFNPATENTTSKAFGKFVQDSLANIVVSTQKVDATSVVVNGPVTVNSSGFEGKVTPSQIGSKLPSKSINTGTGNSSGELEVRHHLGKQIEHGTPGKPYVRNG